MININYNPILLAILVYVCVASAQQHGPSQNGISAATFCNTTTTKPTPAVKSYIFDTCIVAKFASYLTIGNGEYLELNDGVVDTNHSHCEKSTNQTTINPRLVLNFTCGQLEFEMARSNESQIFVESINGYYRLANESLIFANSTPLFITTESGHYYKCNAEQSVVVDSQDHKLVLSNFAYEVFRTATGTDFHKIPEECALDAGQVSDLVRIGVGICLVALVVIVLIAYFVGRRRWSERSSYESV